MFNRALLKRNAARSAAGRSRIQSIPAPVGGWNTRDPVASMERTDARTLDNLWPLRGKVMLRRGYEDYITTGIGSDNVETLITLKSGGTEHFVATTNNKVWEITNAGSPSDRTGAATITVDRWQWTVFADSGTPTTPTVLAVNGTDAPWQWTGSGNIAAWAPTGPTAASLVGVHVHKNRVYAWEADTRDFWYGSLGAIPGAMTRFPLSGIRGIQGNLLFMATWTRDAGDGPDDYAVFVTDQGSAIIYAGTDPGTASAWQIVGVYRIPRPLSVRAWAQIGGDLVVATESDYVTFSQAIAGAGLTFQPSKLVGALTDAVELYRANYGWELVVWPEGSMLLSNVPLNTNSEYQQHVINTETRAAARFTGWPFRTFGVFDGKLYGAGSGAVYRCASGFSDDADGTPVSIKARASTAWTNFGSPGNKQVTALRLMVQASQDFGFAARVMAEFRDQILLPTQTESDAADLPEWDVPDWDTVFWATAPGSRLNRSWRAASGRGTYFSVAVAFDAKEQAYDWLTTDYLVSPTMGI